MSLSDARYLPYARETALCVDVAFEGIEEDLRRELLKATGETEGVLRRLLDRVSERREALERFTSRASISA